MRLKDDSRSSYTKILGGEVIRVQGTLCIISLWSLSEVPLRSPSLSPHLITLPQKAEYSFYSLKTPVVAIHLS